MKKSGHIFVSYARTDSAFVQRLSDAITGHQREPWVDRKDIAPTAEWLREIYAAIEAADDFIFVISPDSCASKTCRLELDHATENHKRLIPVVCRDVDVGAVPPALTRLNWILFREIDNAHEALELLFRALDTDLERVREHTRLLVRSIEWDSGSRDESLLMRGADLQTALAWLTRAGTEESPAPTKLQGEYVRESQVAESRELERVRGLYERALAAQLAAQARWLGESRLGAMPLAMLLAVESMKRLPSPQAEEALRRGLDLHPKRVTWFSRDAGVSILTFSPKGDVLATASGAFTDRERFEAESRKRPSLEDFVDQEDLDDFLNRGKRAVHDPAGGSTVLWETFTGRELARLEHAGSVVAAAFSPDGSQIATASADGVARVWQVPDGRRLCAVDLDTHPWNGTVELTEDGAWLIERRNDAVPRVWEVATGSEARPRDAKHAIRSSDATRRRKTQTRDAALHRSIARFHRSELDDGASDLGIALRSDWKKEDVVGAITDAVLQRANAVSPDGRYFADAHHGTTDSDTVSVCDVLGAECARVSPGGFVAAVVFHPSSRYFSTVVEGRVDLWEVEVQGPLRFLPRQYSVGTLAFSRDGRFLVTAEEKTFSDIEANAAIWDVETGEPVEPTGAEQRGMLAAARNPWRIAHADGTLRASRDEPDRTVEIRSPGSRRIQHKLAHSGWVQCAVFGSDGLLATGTDRGAHVWDARTGRELLHLPHEKQVRAVALDREGTRLATASDDHCARVYGISTGKQLLRVRHEHAVGAVNFSPDGAFLATGGDDSTARAWDLSTGREVARLLHDEPVRAVCFSPDGGTLATGSLGGEAALWVCRPDRLIDRACGCLIRNLTLEEWEHHLPDEPYRATCGKS